MYDLIIKNASVIDGLGNEPYIADIGIKSGKIESIGSKLSGACETIDATGLTVTPGFIDSHSHSDRDAVAFPDQKEKIEQGITFSITGQCGGSEAPKRLSNGDIETVEQYFSAMKQIPQGSYSGMLIGHNSLRRAVMGDENRAPTEVELEQMKALLRNGLEAGALGMSFGLFYIPGAYAKLDEAISLARVVAECGGILAAHLRSESDGLEEAVREYLEIIKESGCRAVFSHHKAMWRENYGKIPRTLAMIDKANADGAEVYLDVYPYSASSTTLMSRFVPGFLHPEGTKSAVSLLSDNVFCAKVKEWGNKTWGNDLSFALITEYPANPEYEGMRVSEIAKSRGESDQYDTVLALLRESGGRGSACYFCMDEEDICQVIAHPRAMICTDSGVKGKAVKHHPRLVASFPRAIAKYVREDSVVSLPEMIRKMTSLPARVYGLEEKGIIREGMDADLCIFDAERITDRADYINCSLANEGLCYVILDGKTVLENGCYNGTRAARVCTKV
ncbi:MAG: D-aminoacylase [Clostridia bacterium]|nr:D-aminoacylase [Clostridia bacterium]